MSIQITTHELARAEAALRGPASALLMLTRRPPATDACAAAVKALEGAVEEYVAALAKVKAVGRAEADHAAKIRAEAKAAVEEGRAPKKITRPDFADARAKAQATADALLNQAKRARTALDRQMAADADAQAAQDARRVPALYEETVVTVNAAGAAFARLLEARESAIEQLGGNPDFAVRSLPWHGPVRDGLASVEKWLAENRDALTDFVFPVADVQPPLDVRRQMAAAGDLARLYPVELREGWTVTQYSRGYRPPLVAQHAPTY